jgi:phospholipase/carboxylesterase
MDVELDGPRIAARSGTAKQLVVFIHGYGADGNDLIELGRLWQPLLPDAAFVAPDAPWHGVRQAAPALRRFIDAELTRLGVAPSALALVGFSQGTMMALHIGLRRTTPPAAIVGYSGLLAAPNQTDIAAMAPEIVSRPPVLLIHGDSDPLIPPQALPMSASALRALGVNVETHMSPGVGHGIGEDGLRLGAEFLIKAFAR